MTSMPVNKATVPVIGVFDRVIIPDPLACPVEAPPKSPENKPKP